MELTKKQLGRQDFVDNAIFDLIQNLNPNNIEIAWNIELIAEVRDIIRLKFSELKICDEMSFYPYVAE